MKVSRHRPWARCRRRRPSGRARAHRGHRVDARRGSSSDTVNPDQLIGCLTDRLRRPGAELVAKGVAASGPRRGWPQRPRRPAWCRSPTATMPAARYGSRPPAGECSGSSRPGGVTRSGRATATSSGGSSSSTRSPRSTGQRRPPRRDQRPAPGDPNWAPAPVRPTTWSSGTARLDETVGAAIGTVYRGSMPSTGPGGSAGRRPCATMSSSSSTSPSSGWPTVPPWASRPGPGARLAGHRPGRRRRRSTDRTRGGPALRRGRPGPAAPQTTKRGQVPGPQRRPTALPRRARADPRRRRPTGPDALTRMTGSAATHRGRDGQPRVGNTRTILGHLQAIEFSATVGDPATRRSAVGLPHDGVGAVHPAPTRGGATPRRLLTRHGHRGHRHHLAPAARRVRRGVRAGGVVRHGGPRDSPRVVAAALPVGAAPGTWRHDGSERCRSERPGVAVRWRLDGDGRVREPGVRGRVDHRKW